MTLELADTYEYKTPSRLDAMSARYFRVPSSVILDIDMGSKRIAAFAFFSVRRGLDNRLEFSVNSMVRWTGKKPNRHSGCINDRFLDAVSGLARNGYVSVDGRLGGSSYAEVMFDALRVSQDCDQERFATIYLDELEKILGYRNPNTRDPYLNNDTTLLVFAYLRMMIFKRRNRFFPEEADISIDARRAKSPEVYNGYYRDIANDIGLSERTVSKAVGVLVELGLIYVDEMPRMKHNGKWVTGYTLFCNVEKREGGFLLDGGSEYFARETRNKKLLLAKKNF